MKNRLDLNKKPIFFAADFATEEMCSFQGRSDATESPNMDRLSHIFRVFEPKRISGRFLFLLLEIKQLLILLKEGCHIIFFTFIIRLLNIII